MIRLILYLVRAGGFAIIVSWFAEQTGQTTIIWLDTEVSLPTSLAIGGMIGLFVVAGFCARLFRKFLSWPGLIAYNWRERRRRDGEKGAGDRHGCFAAGDIKRARRQAKKSEKLPVAGYCLICYLPRQPMRQGIPKPRSDIFRHWQKTDRQPILARLA